MKAVEYKTPDELKEFVRQNKKALQLLVQQLKKIKPPELDYLFHSLHEEAFARFDCLSCANCCRSISPIVKETDIDTLARFTKNKTSQFINLYLHRDEENDYVFNQTPCPFLLPDNYCSVYGYHPKACREYPHTNRRKMHQILQLTLKNCEICPVVCSIMEELRNKYLKLSC